MQNLDPVYLDESLELQDPYSDLSLFLLRKVKEQFHSTGKPKKWSLPIQDRLLEKISAEFQKKFPRYRLGAAPLKRVWDKVSHFSELFEKQHDALTPEGKLNLHFLVRENLKTVLVQRKKNSFHPFFLAQQLALKVGESMANFEGVRPALQNLTALIWSAEQHLLPFSTSKTSSTLDVKDRLTLKWMLDALMETPDLPQQTLLEILQKKVLQFQSLKELKQPIPWAALLSIHWASRLLPACSFMQTSSSSLLQKLRLWIQSNLLKVSLEEARDKIQDMKAAYLENPLEPLSISLDELEILCWSSLKEKLPTPDSPLQSLLTFLLKEAQLQLMDRPHQHWQSALHQALQFFIQSYEICLNWSRADYSQRLLYWSLQGELVLRPLYFQETPLLHLIREASESRPLNDPKVTSQIREQFLSRYSSPLIEPACVHQKVDLLRKYVWYHFSSPQETTLDRWILLHEPSVSHLDVETRINHLIARAQKELPLLPVDEKSIRSLIAR